MSKKETQATTGQAEPKREHKSGPGTGYETDGTNYWLAPCLVDSWGEIQDQERTLDTIIQTTIQTVAAARRRVEAQRRKWWDTVYRDLELDRTVIYRFNRIERKLSPMPPETEQEQET